MATFEARCYCGRCHLHAASEPLTICYCHCSDCRRLTGAVLPAFAGFDPKAVNLTCDNAASHEATAPNPGVKRWFCRDCGSALLATFDYVPDQIMVPLGLFDDLEPLAPRMHTHEGQRPSWLVIHDTLPRDTASGRDRLNQSKMG